jgi:hypothetical protein
MFEKTIEYCTAVFDSKDYFYNVNIKPMSKEDNNAWELAVTQSWLAVLNDLI